MKAELYGTEWCGYCARAKGLLKAHGIDFVETLVDEEGSLDQVAERIGKRVTSVPQIFLGGEYIGGYTELEAHLKLAKAG